MTESAAHLFCFGFGYSARALAATLNVRQWRVSGTCRTQQACDALAAQGLQAVVFDGDRPLANSAAVLAGVTHILSSIPPDANGDPVLNHYRQAIASAAAVRWIGYLSTTGVYGDTGGEVVDETAALLPTSERSIRRVAAERLWLSLFEDQALPVHIFRLAGIYGPGRSAIDQVRRGEARRIERPGHLFSRIHVDDIAAVLRASIDRPHPGAIYNVCDDEPAAPADVVNYACRLLGVAAPPAISFEQALPTLSAMARSFWRDNRRVDNRRIKRDLGVILRHPSYRSGLAAIASLQRPNPDFPNR